MGTKRTSKTKHHPPSNDGLDGIRAIAEGVSSSVKKRVSDTRQHKKAVTQDRPRRRFSFWLEIGKDDQCDLWEWFTELKTMRKFAPVIRYALCLYRELLAGDTTMLYELRPELKPTPPPTTSPEIEKMKKKIESLEDQVELLKGILIKQSGPGAVDMGVKMSSVGQGAPVHTPRQTFAQRQPVVDVIAPVVEVDTSSAFLDAF